jgi:hypothetical protein
VLVLPALFPVVGLGVLVVLAAGYVVMLRRRRGRWPWPARTPGQHDRWAVAAHAVIVGALIAVVALTFVVVARYPQVVTGSGTPIFATLLVVILTGYLAATLLLTRTLTAAVRYALPAGLTTAMLWTLEKPAGGTYHVTQPWLYALYLVGLVVAFAGGPLVAGTLVARRTGALETGVATAAATGMYAALANLIGGLVLVMLLPEYVPFDSDVLRRHHTPASILGANVGENLVVFIGLLVLWPLVGMILGTVGGALGAISRRSFGVGGFLPFDAGRAAPGGQEFTGRLPSQLRGNG